MTPPVVAQPNSARAVRFASATESNCLTATYQVAASVAEVAAVAEGIALEQTVEVPEHFIRDPLIRETILGRVLQISPLTSTSIASRGESPQFEVKIGFPGELVAGSLSQLVNLLYGNISLKRQIRLTHVDFPTSVLRGWRGPNYGVDGLRQMTGVFGRPLLATALKPRGSSAEYLANLAHQFAAGGGDLVKDDHNLVEASFDEFCQRIELCQAGVLSGRMESGANTVYFPNLVGTPRELWKRAEFLVKLGIRGALVAPSILGLDVVRQLAEDFPLAFLAHPTYSGAQFHDPAHGMDPEFLLGTLYRLAGCDGTIFPNSGGRFTFDPQQCRHIADAALAPLEQIRAGLPAPAGGMSFETIPAMARQYGADAIFLIGGALLSDSVDLAKSTAKYLAAIEQLFPDGQRQVVTETVSACEIPRASSAGLLLDYLRFQPEFRWEGRADAPYKVSSSLPFRDVRRVELVGTTGEKTAFDLRYFEIAPGGHSSLERHQHTHVVIAARGTGVLQIGETTHSLQPFDVGYVAPMQPHQLRNPGQEPFGFFCIVDHIRDQPLPP